MAAWCRQREARLGARQGGPGGNWIVSMMTRPPVVAMVVRAQPGSPGDPGGHWKSERADPGTLMIGA